MLQALGSIRGLRINRYAHSVLRGKLLKPYCVPHTLPLSLSLSLSLTHSLTLSLSPVRRLELVLLYLMRLLPLSQVPPPTPSLPLSFFLTHALYLCYENVIPCLALWNTCPTKMVWERVRCVCLCVKVCGRERELCSVFASSA